MDIITYGLGGFSISCKLVGVTMYGMMIFHNSVFSLLLEGSNDVWNIHPMAKKKDQFAMLIGVT